MSLYVILATLVIIAVGVPSLFLSTELLLGMWPWRQFNTDDMQRDGCTILIPAHNEEPIIAKTLSRLIKGLDPRDRIVVVADNCNDKTVEICQQFDVEVIERHNKQLRGKGYALDFGIQHIAKNPPKTLVIFDADSVFTFESLDILVSQSERKNSIVQSMYLMKSPEGSPCTTRAAEFAWMVKNKTRPIGMHRLGLGCHLQGSGMAFPWKLISNISLASGNIVEDLELSLKLAGQGHKVLFEPSAEVISYFPSSAAGLKSQRTRWEHGHLASIGGQLPKLMITSLLSGRFSAFLMALDASIPPTILLLLLVLLATALSAVGAMFGSLSPFYSTFGTMLWLGMSISLVWLAHGRQILSVRDFTGVITYALDKLPIYMKFLNGRQKDWVRTEQRNDLPPPA